MVAVTFILMSTIRREELENAKKDEPIPAISTRQIMYGSLCLGFAVFVLTALNYYSKKYVIEFGALDRNSISANSMMRIVSPKPLFGYREKFVPLSDISSTSIPKLMNKSQDKKDDYIYLQLRGQRGNLLIDVTTAKSYLDRNAALTFLTQANYWSESMPQRTNGWTPIKKWKT